MNEMLKTLGIGLSRVLRYSYGGFLLIVFAAVLEKDALKSVREAVSWELMALTAVVLGAGLYPIHRNVVIPLHHGLLCLIWWGVERKDKSESTSPTRWLASIDVPFVWRISAYTALRRSDLFEKEKPDWDIEHAEMGLVVMTAEAFFVAAIYACSQANSPVNWRLLGGLSIVFFIFSYAGFIQHGVECLRFKQKEEEVKETLRKLGMIRVSSQGEKGSPGAPGGTSLLIS